MTFSKYKQLVLEVLQRRDAARYAEIEQLYNSVQPPPTLEEQKEMLKILMDWLAPSFGSAPPG